jgi:hypothetical protein
VSAAKNRAVFLYLVVQTKRGKIVGGGGEALHRSEEEVRGRERKEKRDIYCRLLKSGFWKIK